MGNERISVRSGYSRVRTFFQQDIWALGLERLPRRKAFLIRLSRVLTTAINEFFKDQCLLRASALTFYTLLSVVPVLAVIFGLEKMMEKELMQHMAGQEEMLERILTFARNMLENTKGGLIAGVGVAVMFWSAIKVLGQIESAWIQVSWTIVLFGAELCYAVHHSRNLCSAGGCPIPTPVEKKLIGLHIVRKAIERFAAGAPAMTARQIAIATAIPLPLVQRVAADLAATSILSQTSTHPPEEPRFQPAIDLHLLTLQRVSDALDAAGGSSAALNLPCDAETAALRDALQQLSQAAAGSPANRLLKDI